MKGVIVLGERGKPRLQKVVAWVGFLLAGCLAAGALLDAISNAFTLVRPATTYIVTAVVVVLWLLAEVAMAFLGIKWVGPGGQPMTLRGFGPRVRLGLCGILALLWVPRLGDIPLPSKHVPPITVKLLNHTPQSVEVARLGEFVLWLPSAMYDGAPRVGGKFAFRLTGDRGYIDSPITLLPGDSLWAVADLFADDVFTRYLDRGDTEVTLIVRTSLGLKTSDEMPFLRSAIGNRYIAWRLDAKD